jgi:hypothetical protein
VNARRITTAQLLNLADRTPHGLTPDETTRLRDGVAHHCARAEQAEAERDTLGREADRLFRTAAQALARAEKAERAVDHLTDRYRGAEAAIERVRAVLTRIERARKHLHGNTESMPIGVGMGLDDAARAIRAALAEHQDPKP